MWPLSLQLLSPAGGGGELQQGGASYTGAPTSSVSGLRHRAGTATPLSFGSSGASLDCLLVTAYGALVI